MRAGVVGTRVLVAVRRAAEKGSGEVRCGGRQGEGASKQVPQGERKLPAPKLLVEGASDARRLMCGVLRAPRLARCGGAGLGRLISRHAARDLIGSDEHGFARRRVLGGNEVEAFGRDVLRVVPVRG